MEFRLILYISFFLLLFSNCVRENVFEIDFENKTVIHSVFNIDKKAEVFVYKNFPFEQTATVKDVLFIDDAVVTLFDGEKIYATELKERSVSFINDNGYLDSFTTKSYKTLEKIPQGDTLFLTAVTTDGIFSANEAPVHKPIISHIELDSIEQTNLPGYYNYFLKVYLDEVIVSDFYRYRLKYTYDYIDTLFTYDTLGNIVDSRLDTFTLRNNNLSNNFIPGNEAINTPIYIFLNNQVPLIGNKENPYELEITFYNYPSFYVEYLQNIKDLPRADQFQDPFNEPLNNLTNINGEDALGIFSVISPSETSTFEVYPKFD